MHCDRTCAATTSDVGRRLSYRPPEALFSVGQTHAAQPLTSTWAKNKTTTSLAIVDGNYWRKQLGVLSHIWINVSKDHSLGFHSCLSDMLSGHKPK